MMIHDDDVTLRGATMHLRDEAAVPLRTLLAGTTLAARIELLPELCIFGKTLQFGAVTAFRGGFPFGNLPVLVNFLESAQNRLVGEIVKLLPAKIIVAAFHITNAQLAQMLLEEWYILEKELFLQVLGAGGNNHAFAAADHR